MNTSPLRNLFYLLGAFSMQIMPFWHCASWRFLEDNATQLPGSGKGQNRKRCRLRISLMVFAVLASAPLFAAAPAKPAANPTPDVLVLKNGDTLHGKLVKEAGGAITFHTDELGDVSVKWSDVKSLHTSQDFAVLNKAVKLRGKKSAGQIPAGTLDATSQIVTVRPNNAVPLPPIPVADAQYIVDQKTLDMEVYHQPNFFTAWNGAATAGATIVAATQNQYTASGSVGLVRTIPTVTWLNTRNRTSIDFSGSFGKITEPGVPTVKTAIFHAGAERDEYVSSRFFALGQTAFDHNFAQGLALQSEYGGGMGWTAVKDPKHQLDLKATVQYESQQFIPPTTPGVPGTPNQNLIGSTFSASYGAHFKLLTFTQVLAFIPAFNHPHDYSANETDTVSFPAYKSLSFTVGTLDSYLNDPPLSVPATKPNSFQFTMGITYAIKSKY